MRDGITHVGLDAHQETIVVAVLLADARQLGEDRFANTPEAVARGRRRGGRGCGRAWRAHRGGRELRVGT